jgi:hypothetical protein
MRYAYSQPAFQTAAGLNNGKALARCYKFLVTAAFYDLAFFQYDDLISLADG